MNWQPIETAPRDGTLVTLGHKWYDGPALGRCVDGIWVVDREHVRVDCGHYCYGGVVASDLDPNPSHWMPAPDTNELPWVQS